MVSAAKGCWGVSAVRIALCGIACRYYGDSKVDLQAAMVGIRAGSWELNKVSVLARASRSEEAGDRRSQKARKQGDGLSEETEMPGVKCRGVEPVVVNVQFMLMPISTPVDLPWQVGVG